MSVATSVADGLHAALLLARGRPDGMRFVANDMAAATRSFWAAAVCLPLFLVLRALPGDDAGLAASAGHLLALDLLTYVVGWAGFAVLSVPLVRALGRAALWPRFIVIWNWCNVVQCLLALAASLPGLLGAPTVADEAAQLVAKGWALWVEWYAIRLALGVSTLTAIGLVALDIGLGTGLAVLSLVAVSG